LKYVVKKNARIDSFNTAVINCGFCPGDVFVRMPPMAVVTCRRMVDRYGVMDQRKDNRSTRLVLRRAQWIATDGVNRPID
jgi:hypothetical protein